MGFLKNWRNRKEMKAMAEGKALADAKAKEQAEREVKAKKAMDAAILAAFEAVKGEQPAALAVVAVTRAGTFVAQAGAGAAVVEALEGAQRHVRDQSLRSVQFNLPKPPEPTQVATPTDLAAAKLALAEAKAAELEAQLAAMREASGRADSTQRMLAAAQEIVDESEARGRGLNLRPVPDPPATPEP